MARAKSMAAVEAEVSQARVAVVKVKAGYEAALGKLQDTMASKDVGTARELLSAFKGSGKLYAMVIRYLQEEVSQ